MSRDANIVPITVETLISPSVSVTGSIRTRKRRTAGSRQSKATRNRPSRPRSHGSGSRNWTSVATTIEPAYT